MFINRYTKLVLSIILVFAGKQFFAGGTFSKPSGPETKLMEACDRNDLEAVKKIIADNPGININAYHKVDYYYDGPVSATALMVAAAKGYRAIAQYLIEKRADVNAYDYYGNTAVSLAAHKGHADIVSDLLAADALVTTSRWTRRENALHQAVRAGHADVVKVLIKHGMDIVTPIEGNYTVLMCAASRGHTGVVAALLEAGADVNARDDDGTALVHAAREGTCDGYSDYDDNGHRSWVPESPAIYDNLEMIKLLVEHGADVNASDDDGWTPLFWAAHHDRYALCAYLIDHHALVNAHTKLGATVLHESASRNFSAVSQLLLDHGAEIDTPGKVGRTPLHLAAMNNYPDIARILVVHGANIYVKDNEGSTAFDIAEKRHATDVLAYFKIIMAKKSAIIHALLACDALLKPAPEEPASKEARTSACGWPFVHPLPPTAAAESEFDAQKEFPPELIDRVLRPLVNC